MSLFLKNCNYNILIFDGNFSFAYAVQVCIIGNIDIYLLQLHAYLKACVQATALKKINVNYDNIHAKTVISSC